MSHQTLQIIWYLLIYVLLAGYAILDGYDLGVGVLSPFIARNDKERRTLLSAVGPFWDGNEVWLLTAGGALFAAFPHVYATLFSGFYLALMLLLFALILRAVSFEFRNHVQSAAWRRTWDWVFFFASLLPALLTGVAMGNVIIGVPLNAEMEFAGNFFTLLNPLALLFGLGGVAMYMLQGAVFLTVKTEGDLADRARRQAKKAWLALLVMLVLIDIFAFINLPQRYQNFWDAPLTLVFPLIMVVFLVLTRTSLNKDKPGRTFLFSSLTIAGLLATLAAADFPNLLPASNMVKYSLTIFNASGSVKNLTAMLIIALIGMPLVLVYTIYIHRLFRGKVKVEEEGY